VPTVSRARAVPAAAEEVWRVVSDPSRIPEWWPGGQRVEDVSADAFTLVLSSPRGKAVRADYTVVEKQPPHAVRWRQELEESPFERLFSESLVHVELEPLTDGSTEVTLTSRLRMRGMARLGWIQVRRATRRRLDAALAALCERAAGRTGG
jgi:uncharacterized protein YndB with AHSA1/START domain